jgi:hypothetical protein
MQFPRSTHAEGWHALMPARPLPDIPIVTRDADAVSPPVHSRGFHALVLTIAVGALGASAGLDAIEDPRPLDVQLSTAMHHAADTLRDWQGQLTRGLQVSLRAVADGRDTSPRATSSSDATVVAQADAAKREDADDRDQPVRADLAPRQMQPVR